MGNCYSISSSVKQASTHWLWSIKHIQGSRVILVVRKFKCSIILPSSHLDLNTPSSSCASRERKKWKQFFHRATMIVVEESRFSVSYLFTFSSQPHASQISREKRCHSESESCGASTSSLSPLLAAKPPPWCAPCHQEKKNKRINFVTPPAWSRHVGSFDN